MSHLYPSYLTHIIPNPFFFPFAWVDLVDLFPLVEFFFVTTVVLDELCTPMEPNPKMMPRLMAVVVVLVVFDEAFLSEVLVDLDRLLAVLLDLCEPFPLGLPNDGACAYIIQT